MREGRRGRRGAEEKESHEADRIRDVDHDVIVDVGALEATQSCWLAQEQESERLECIGHVNEVVERGVAVSDQRMTTA